MDRELQLTPHFKLGEFLHAEVKTIPDEIFLNLKALAVSLEHVREQFGKPVIITSGYRTPEHNRAVGGSRRSFHLKGLAADIVIPKLSAQAVQKALKNWPGGMGLAATFTHLDIRPYRARWTY